MPGSPIDLPHIEDTGATGIGLFRTELQFMVATTLPRTGEQLALYRSVLDAAGKKPVTFRTLDIGGDKVLPYMRNYRGRKPGAGLARDQARSRSARPAAQPGARVAARGGRARSEAHVSDDRGVVEEFDKAKALVERELTHLRRHGHELPGAGRDRDDGRGARRSCSSSTNCSSASISSRSAPTI